MFQNKRCAPIPVLVLAGWSFSSSVGFFTKLQANTNLRRNRHSLVGDQDVTTVRNTVSVIRAISWSNRNSF